MSKPITDEEFGRRLSAARGYHPKGRSQKGFAKYIGMDRGKLNRYELGKLPALSRPGLRELFVEKTGLPDEFFVIHFTDLPAMVEAWKQAGGGDGAPSVEDDDLSPAELARRFGDPDEDQDEHEGHASSG